MVDSPVPKSEGPGAPSFVVGCASYCIGADCHSLGKEGRDFKEVRHYQSLYFRH